MTAPIKTCAGCKRTYTPAEFAALQPKPWPFAGRVLLLAQCVCETSIAVRQVAS